MPQFDAAQEVARPLSEAFDFFRRPANLVRMSPPELHMHLVEGPERVELGSRIAFRGRRWGVPQRVVSEVTLFELNVLFQDEQREGPFARWVHTHRFEPLPGGGTRILDRIDYEPPGGLLGLVVTAASLERDLKWIFTYRAQKINEFLGDSPPG